MNSEYKPISNLWKDSKGYRYFGTLKLSSEIKYDGDDFIPLWELVKQLQQENQQLKDNWNKLKEWIVYNKHNENTEQHYLVVDYGTLLGKMKELEGSDSNGI